MSVTVAGVVVGVRLGTVDVVVEGFVFDTPWVGETDTSWKTPLTALNTTTIAGVVTRPTVMVPVPCPPVVALQSLHETPVTVTGTGLLLQPMSKVFGRTCGVDAGPQERTVGCPAAVVPVVAVVGAVDVPGGTEVAEWDGAVVLLALFFAAGGDDRRPTATPTAIPAPRAASTATTIPIRTTVLRRTVMTLGSLLATGQR